ncbi:MAG: alpha/beta fold hydrolase [Alphaproteobacteria bacterium]|nr:alpha/beta fold hydrolase [Alphaproteobacteria bacterium]
MNAQTLIRPDGTALTYDKFAPENPAAGAGVIFLHGFRSDRKATKVSFLKEVCEKASIPYLCFDFFAHGESGGDWADFTIGRAVHDALLVLDTLTEGPQIMVGSSMGGWVALRAMEERADRIAGIVGVAAAPDFTKWVAAKGTTEERRAQGFTDALMAEAENQYVMDEDWSFEGPVHLLQGQMDDEVPWETVEAILCKFKKPQQVVVTLVPDGDHRLNRPEDLQLLENALFDVRNKI